MCSTPPAMTTSAAPMAISPAPAVIAVSAPAHMRSTANPGTGLRQAGEKRDVAPERQPLVADLSGRGHDHVADALGWQRRVAPQQLADDLDRHVVGPRAPEDALLARAAERRPHAVDEVDLSKFADPSAPSGGGYRQPGAAAGLDFAARRHPLLGDPRCVRVLRPHESSDAGRKAARPRDGDAHHRLDRCRDRLSGSQLRARSRLWRFRSRRGRSFSRDSSSSGPGSALPGGRCARSAASIALS